MYARGSWLQRSHPSCVLSALLLSRANLPINLRRTRDWWTVRIPTARKVHVQCVRMQLAVGHLDCVRTCTQSDAERGIFYVYLVNS